MLNPWVLIGVAIVWALSIVGASTKWASLKVSEVQAEWLAQENAKLVAANKRIAELQDEAREKDRAHAEALDNIATNYEKEKANAEARRKRDIVAARDGAIRLRLPATVCPDAGGSAHGPPAPATSGGDGAAQPELPRAIVGDLLDLANDADAVVLQLTACQRVIISDRERINEAANMERIR